MSDLLTSNSSSNYNRLFNNQNFIQTLLNNVRNKLGRQLTTPEKLFMVNFLQGVNPAILKRPPAKIMEFLVQKITETIEKTPCAEDAVDIHELLKNEIGVSTEDITVETDTDFTQQITASFSNKVDVASIFGSKSFDVLKGIFNPEAVKKTSYLLLDSRYRVLDTDGRSVLKWNVSSDTSTVQGSTNAVGNIQNIISMRSFDMKMPYTASADNQYDRVTMFVQEFSAQSFIAHENRLFHYMYESDVKDRYIDLKTPRDSDGLYKFKTPITRLDSISLSFGSPLEPITFDVDRMLMVISDYHTDNLTTFESTSPHNLETGDRVYIRYFTTINPDADAPVISAINSTTGNVATITDLTHFTLEINSSALQVDGIGFVNVVNGSPIVNGVSGSQFLTEFLVNDYISISGIKYKVIEKVSDTQLIISTNYPGVTANNIFYAKDNTITGLKCEVYFGSKRIFIPMEFEYLDVSSS